MNGMKFSHRSASLSSFDVYSRFLDMHDELQKSSKSLNSIINQSLRLVSNKEEPRFSFSAEYQQNINSFDKISEEEDQQTQPLNNEKEEHFNKLIFANEININCLREVKIAWLQQFDCAQYSFGIDQKQEEIEDINQTNRVEREKFKQQLINMQQSLGQ